VAIGSGRWSSARDTVAGTVLRSSWLRQGALLWDAVNTRWHAWVVGYGPELQRALLASFGIGNLRRAERWAVLLGLAIASTVGLLVTLSLYLSWRHRRRTHADPAARQFAAFAQRLTRLHVPPRAPNEGPQAYAARASALLPQAAAEIATIAALYLRARYEPDPERTALEELRAHVATFRPLRA
jgi:hypothetical protein